MRPWTWLPALVLLLWSAAAAPTAAGEPVLLFEDSPGDATDGIDVRYAAVAVGTDNITVRLAMHESGLPGSEGHPSQSDFRVILFTQVQSKGGGPSVVAFIALRDPLDGDGGARLRVVSWSGSLADLTDQRARELAEHAAPVPSQGSLDGTTFEWTVALEHLRLRGDAWTISSPFAHGHVWTNLDRMLGTRMGLWHADHVRDRAPDDGYGQTVRVQAPAGDAVVQGSVGATTPFGLPPPDLNWQTLAWTGLALLALVGKAGWPLLTAMFTRLDRKAALEHPRRALIHETINQRPDITFAELRRRLHIGSGSLAHHLAVLEKQELVRCAVQGGRRLYRVPRGTSRG